MATNIFAISSGPGDKRLTYQRLTLNGEPFRLWSPWFLRLKFSCHVDVRLDKEQQEVRKAIERFVLERAHGPRGVHLRLENLFHHNPETVTVNIAAAYHMIGEWWYKILINFSRISVREDGRLMLLPRAIQIRYEEERKFVVERLVNCKLPLPSRSIKNRRRMASSAKWTVIIVTEEYEGLDKNYRLPQTTCLADIMLKWVEDFRLLGNWRFVSPDQETEYKEWMSLEMVGETVLNSGMVNLKAELSDSPIPRPVNEIFAQIGDQCHLLHVKPTQKLYDVLSCLPGRSSTCHCNDEQLNLLDTVEQAGLENNALIHEPRRQTNVNVKLSYGNIVIIRVPEDSLVLHLYEAIQRYEVDDFSLEYEGRHLKPDERVKKLKQVIQVTSVQFAVNIHDQRITWTTKGSPIDFPTFISQLSSKANFKEEQLEKMEYRCIGCQRRISRSEDETQILPIDCCKEKSLTLTVTSPFEQKSNSTAATMIEFLQSYYVQLFAMMHQDGRTSDSRDLCGKLKEELSTMEMSYNTVIRNIEDLLRTIKDPDKEIEQEEGDEEKKKEIERYTSRDEVKDKEDTDPDSTGEMEMVKDVNIDTKGVIEDTQIGATAGPPHPGETSVENPGVELFVVYSSKGFAIDASRPEVQSLEERSNPLHRSLKCVVPGLRPGWATFEDVRNAIQPLFVTGRIRGIRQCRNNFGETIVAHVAIPHENKRGKVKFANINGRQYSTKDVKKKYIWITATGDHQMEEYLKTICGKDVVDKGGEVLIIGGRNRTALQLVYLPSAD